MNDLFNLTGKVALVTGAGAGLGAAFAETLAEAGASVVCADINGAHAERTVADLTGKGYQAVSVTTDVTDPGQVQAAVDLAVATYGRLDIAVANAGVASVGPPEAMSFGDWKRVIDVNLTGVFLTDQAAAKAMLPQGRGTILFTGATASIRGSANFAPFAIAKFGLRALGQSLARELGPKGIHVAHVLIDGQIGHAEGDGKLRPEAIAESYWHLHCQPRSAWTQELDIRPWAEKY